MPKANTHTSNLSVETGAVQAIFLDRVYLQQELSNNVADLSPETHDRFVKYWIDNPINAWIGGNLGASSSHAWFQLEGDRFVCRATIDSDRSPVLNELVDEIVTYRMYTHTGVDPASESFEVLQAAESAPSYSAERTISVPEFPNIPVACGHFRTGQALPDVSTRVRLADPDESGNLFVATAVGESMDGGDRPVRDGDRLLLDFLVQPDTPANGDIVVLERFGDDTSYVLRRWHEDEDGTVHLIASNPAYAPIVLTDDVRPVARLVRKLSQFESVIGDAFMRDEIPPLFDETFNPGKWNAGHVSVPSSNAVVLLVTMDKSGKVQRHRYVDRWENERTFVWQSQNSTSAESKKGREIIDHETTETTIHLFVRARKLGPNGKAAPFTYHGPVRYVRHEGAKPMTVWFELM